MSPPIGRRAESTVLTVFGAKGGIGKSTIASNVAAAIARDTKRSVLIMDMDVRFGDVAIMLGVDPDFTVADMARRGGQVEPDTLRRILYEHESGCFVLPAPVHPSEWAEVSADQIGQMVDLATHAFDYVILDTPGTFTDLVATGLQVADMVLVISGLDMTSIKDTARMFDLLDAEGYPLERLSLVVNQVTPRQTVTLPDVAQILGQTVFWSIPYDDQVPLSIGRSLVMAKPRSRAAKQLRGLAAELCGLHQAGSVEGGLLGRILPWRRGPSERSAA